MSEKEDPRETQIFYIVTKVLKSPLEVPWKPPGSPYFPFVKSMTVLTVYVVCTVSFANYYTVLLQKRVCNGPYTRDFMIPFLNEKAANQ